MSSTCSAASVDSASASSEPGCEPSRFAKSSLSVVPSSPNTGPASPVTTTCELSPQLDLLPTESVPSMSSAEATPASRSHTPANSEASKTLAISGRKCADLLAKSDPLGSLLKTLLVTSHWGSTRCSLTWKPTATPGGRLLFRLQPSMPRTSGNGSGSWLATATATANQLAPSMQKHPGCRAIFPTPLAGDGKKMSSMSKARKASGRKPDSLPEYVRMWPTPTARDHKDTGDCANVPVNALLGRAVGPSRMSGSLNPEFVEWLMGFPVGWTDCEPSATPSSRKSSRSSAKRS